MSHTARERNYGENNFSRIGYLERLNILIKIPTYLIPLGTVKHEDKATLVFEMASGRGGRRWWCSYLLP